MHRVVFICGIYWYHEKGPSYALRALYRAALWDGRDSPQTYCRKSDINQIHIWLTACSQYLVCKWIATNATRASIVHFLRCWAKNTMTLSESEREPALLSNRFQMELYRPTRLCIFWTTAAWHTKIQNLLWKWRSACLSLHFNSCFKIWDLAASIFFLYLNK